MPPNDSITWQVLTGGGDVIWELTREAPPGTWWPTLYPDLCKLTIGVPKPWDLEGYFDTSRPPTEASPPGQWVLDPWRGCSSPDRRAMLSSLSFYVCPGLHRDRSLNPTYGGVIISIVKPGDVKLRRHLLETLLFLGLHLNWGQLFALRFLQVERAEPGSLPRLVPPPADKFY